MHDPPEDLLRRCERGDPGSQSELYRLVHRTFMPLAFRYKRDRDEALATLNNSYLKMLVKLGSKRKEVPFWPWARKIVMNTLIDEHRKTDRHAGVHQDIEHAEEPGSCVNGYMNGIETEALARMVQTLPDTTRHVFNLYAIDGYSYEEISDLMNTSQATLRWHVNKARATLKGLLTRVAKGTFCLT